MCVDIIIIIVFSKNIYSNENIYISFFFNRYFDIGSQSVIFGLGYFVLIAVMLTRFKVDRNKRRVRTLKTKKKF